MDQKLISVIMSVYNGEKYLVQAIDSILNQTYQNFEFIIIDDCSTDNSSHILQEYAKKDSRIKIIKKEKNIGIKGFIENLNLGISIAKGKYIARMDADDISLPERFQKQVNFLEKNSDFSLCFSNAKILQENNAENYNKMTIVENRKYQDTELLGKWLIPTASTLFINSFTTEDFAILSNPNVLFGDIFLFLILANKGNIKGMENYMTVYRINSESVTNQKKSIIYYEKLFQHLLYLSTIFGGKYKPLLKLGIHNQGYKLFRFYLLKCNIKFINYLSFFLKRFL